MNIHSPTFLFSANATERKSRVFVWFSNPPWCKVSASPKGKYALATDMRAASGFPERNE